MNTADWVVLRQWDAARRCLMLLHPWFALEQAGLALGTWQSGMRPGWNRIVRDKMSEHPVIYTHIASGEGQTTTVPPPPDAGPVHEATKASPDLHTSELWSVLRTRGAELIARGLISSSEQNALEAAIEAAARDKREFDRMRALWHEAMQEMRRAISESSDGTARTPDFMKPAITLVHRYLDCNVAGMVASEVLMAILSTQCTIPVLGPPATMPLASRVAAVEHLADVAYGLLSRRDSLNLEGYFEASYLAALYCRTAFLIADWAKAAPQRSAPEVEKLARIALNVDELFAHRIAPVFVLHALFRPAELLAWVEDSAERGGKSVDHVAEFNQLPPGLRAFLAPEQRSRGLTETEIEEAYHRDSESRAAFDARAALEGEEQPIAEENRKKIMFDLLAMAMGSGALVP